ncbi:MAG: RNA polymerase sigma factor [Lachnospiraceae bacterium]|nr:RNA polymerase sigma factor [Lachnospiraceae bacterium]
MAGSCDYEKYCREGDDEALERIIREFRDGLILYLRTFTGDIHTAEDIAEDTFVKIAVKKPRYNGKASFKTWLYRIAGNMAIDHLRRRRESVPIDDCGELTLDDISLEESYIRDEERIAVHRALGKLPGDYRQILWLVYFEDMQVREAAAVMGRSVHAAETLIYRARRRMKEELEKVL